LAVDVDVFAVGSLAVGSFVVGPGVDADADPDACALSI